MATSTRSRTSSAASQADARAAAAAAAARQGGSSGSGSTAARARISPFNTPEEDQQLNDLVSGSNQSLIDMDAQFGGMAATTHEQAGDMVGGKLNHSGLIYHAQQQNLQAANDALVARGLFQSSIRDGDLADIDATANQRRLSLLNSLGIQSAANDRTRKTIGDRIAAFQRTRDAQAAQHAADKEKDLGPDPATTAGPTGGVAAPAAVVHKAYSPGFTPQGNLNSGQAAAYTAYAQAHSPSYAVAHPVAVPVAAAPAAPAAPVVYSTPGHPYHQAVNTSAPVATQWTQAFQNTHGGATPEVFNYLQALYHAANG